MSIAVMKEGEAMGRGIKPDWRLESRVRSRMKAEEADVVAVLGAGPAGLLAAHAAALAGKQPVIFSAPGDDGHVHKSPVAGATYLHEAIPDLTSASADAAIRFVKLGTREGYAIKVYGSRWAPCSWDRFSEGESPAWALQPAYDDLWDRYSSEIVATEIGPDLVSEFIGAFPLVITTIPAHAICDAGHEFPGRKIWIAQGATDAAMAFDDPVIVYDGTWPAPYKRYRSARIFGFESTEYAAEAPGCVEGIKPLPSSCRCFPEVIRAGRWGTWTPGVLVHHAFKRAWQQMFDSFEGSA